jgi:hypothetical protein
MKVKVDASFEELRSSTLTLCRNDSCHALSFKGLSTPEPDGRIVNGRVYFPRFGEARVGELSYDAAVEPLAMGGFMLRMNYSPSSAADLKDGDVYTVTIKTGAGRKLIDMRQTATYEVTQPNGPECGPVCRQARLN